MPISLKQLADELDGIPDEFSFYLNKVTGETFYIPEDPEMVGDMIEEDSAKMEEIEGSKDWIQMERGEILEPYRTMENFVMEETTGRQQDELLRAIKGKGAFRRFGDQVNRMDLSKKWYAYKQKDNERLVAAWLEAEGIAFGA